MGGGVSTTTSDTVHSSPPFRPARLLCVGRSKLLPEARLRHARRRQQSRSSRRALIPLRRLVDRLLLIPLLALRRRFGEARVVGLFVLALRLHRESGYDAERKSYEYTHHLGVDGGRVVCLWKGAEREREKERRWRHGESKRDGRGRGEGAEGGVCMCEKRGGRGEGGGRGFTEDS